MLGRQMAIVKATMLDLTKVSTTESYWGPERVRMMEHNWGRMMVSATGLHSD